MAELCLVASHGYPPGFFFNPAEQAMGKVYKDFQPLLSNPGLGQDSRQACFYRPLLHLTENTVKPSISMLDGNEVLRHDLTTSRYVLNDGQDFHPDSVRLSIGIAKQFALRERVLRLLMSEQSEESGIDLSVLVDLMERQAPATHWSQQPLLPYDGQALLDSQTHPLLISLNGDFSPEKSIIMGDWGHGSDIMYDMYHPHPDDRMSLTSSPVEMDDVFSTLSEIYTSKDSIKWQKLQTVVPFFDRRTKRAAKVDVAGPSSKESVKSSEKTKNKASLKKKSNAKAVKERDLYRTNSFHACESLLSVLVDKKQPGKTAIHSLRRSGPQLPKVLTQFSASIAGTGLAVLFSVICKVACSRVPFCGSKLLSAGLGLGLVWLSWAVNRLRDTVVTMNKNSEGQLDLREEELMNKLNRSVKEIYFRAATILAVAVLRLA